MAFCDTGVNLQVKTYRCWSVRFKVVAVVALVVQEALVVAVAVEILVVVVVTVLLSNY